MRHTTAFLVGLLLIAPSAVTVRSTSADAGATPLLRSRPVRSETCDYADTWGAPRSGGRRHQGVDIIAALGTPVLAVANGRITVVVRDGERSGNQLSLTSQRGNRYVYTHLHHFAAGIELGVPVTPGQVIGYVGSTGASSGPHLHFEVHPGGGVAVDPMPYIVSVDTCGKNVANRHRGDINEDDDEHTPGTPPSTKPPKPGPTDNGGVGDTPIAATLDDVPARKVFAVQVVGFPGLPADATTVKLKIAVTAAGWARAAVWPCGRRAGLASGTPLTVGNGRRTTIATVRVGSGGRVCLTASRTADWVVAVVSVR